MLIFGPAIRRPRPLMGTGMIGGITYLPTAPGARAPQAAVPVRSASASAPALAARTDLVAELTTLKELLDSGALTADEFAAAKTKLLA